MSINTNNGICNKRNKKLPNSPRKHYMDIKIVNGNRKILNCNKCGATFIN